MGSASVTVDRLSSSTRASVDRPFVPRNSTVSCRIAVSGHVLVPTGDIVVRDGRTVLATVTLGQTDNGRVTVTLPNTVTLSKLSRGIHLLTATYAGNAQLVDSASFPALAFVH